VKVLNVTATETRVLLFVFVAWLANADGSSAELPHKVVGFITGTFTGMFRHYIVSLCVLSVSSPPSMHQLEELPGQEAHGVQDPASRLHHQGTHTHVHTHAHVCHEVQ